MSETTIDRIDSCINRLQRGEASARHELINLSSERLTVLTRRMFKKDDRIKQWEQTDDIRQNAAIRLWKSLEDVTPSSVAEYFAFAATQIRRELIDLARHYFGERGMGKNTAPLGHEDGQPGIDRGETTYEPGQLAAWTEFHRFVESLAPDDRQLVELLWYMGLPQDEVASMLKVDVSTVKRRWRALRMRMAKTLKGWNKAVE
jgi:RNA polymerase sigma-70 factor (ECF subfamily)